MSRPHLLLVAAVALVHGPTLAFGFTGLDDGHLVLERMASLREPSALLRAFGEDAFHSPNAEDRFYYRPLLTVSFALDAWWSGRSAAGYHATNVALHALATLLLFGLLRGETRVGERGAFALALLFALHPLSVPAVAWIPGRNDLLLAVFAIGALLCALRYERSGRPRDLAGHGLLFLLALLTKESALALPLFLGLRLALRPGARRGLALAATWAAVALPWLLARERVLGNPAARPDAETLATAAERLPALVVYLGKAVLPAGLSVHPTLEHADWLPHLAGLALLGALVLAALPRERWREAALGAAWLVLFLLPTLFRPVGRGEELLLLEHRAYVPLVGLALLLAALAPERLPLLASARRRHALGLALAVGFAALALLYARPYRGSLPFWRSAVAAAPEDATLRNHLGTVYYETGSLEEAEREWRRALELSPEEPLVHANLGMLALKRGEWGAAHRALRRELAKNPSHARSHHHLGVVHLKEGRPAAAVAAWERAVALDPRLADAHHNLVVTYWEGGRHAEARRLAERALRAGAELEPALLERIGLRAADGE